MASVNKVLIVGNLGKDPELKDVGSSKVCTFSVATTESYKDKQGNKQDKTEWHNIVIWGKLAEVASKYLRKGSQVYLEGRIQTRSWEDKDGNKRYATEIVANVMQMLGSKESKESNNNQDDGLPF